MGMDATVTAHADTLVAARSDLETRERESARETIGLQISVVAFLLAALAALPVFGFGSAPIAGPGSVGQYAAIASGVAAAIAFILGRIIAKDHQESKGSFGLRMLDTAAFTVAVGIIALLGWTLVAVIIEAGLIGAVVFPLPVVLLSGAAAGGTAYVSYFVSTHLDLQLLATVLAVFLAIGVLASMLTASDPNWWQDNLSALGMTDDVSARTFNLTLIVAGVLVTSLARYATRALPASHRGSRAVLTCLVLIGIFLACVGIFPVDQHFALHTGVASGMAVAFGVLVISLRWWLPGVSTTFVVLGYVFAVTVVILAVLFAVGYYTLTAVELIAGVVIFSWIILFIRAVDVLTGTDDVQAEATSRLER